MNNTDEIIKEINKSEVISNTNKSKKHVIYWDKIFILLAILIVTILGLVSLISFLSSDDSKATRLTDKDLQLATYGKQPAKENVTKDANMSGFTVVIDAGHGDHDSGCIDLTGTRLEKDDNLKMALAVKQRLESQGVTVIMTRSTDVFVSLDDRCKIANNTLGADLFVSLHRNSATEGNGVEIWVSNKRPASDTALARNILNNLEEVGISRNRGVQFGFIGDPDSNYQVNSGTVIPSCLVELGFMTYDEDNNLLDKYFDEYAALSQRPS